MKEITCDQEKEILAAAKNNRLDADQAAHLAQCAGCRDALLVSQWLQEFARGEDLRQPLPAAEALWNRATFQIRRRRQKKALIPILLFQRFSWLAFIVAGSAFLLVYGPSLWHVLATRFSASGLASHLRSLAPVELPAFKILFIAALAVVGIIVLTAISCWLGDFFARRRLFAGRE